MENGEIFSFAAQTEALMIQRIQTLFLAIAGIILILLLLLEPSLANAVGNAGEFFLTPVSIGLTGEGGTSVIQSSFAIAAVLSFGLFLTIFSIMKYNNRKLQMKLVQAAIVVQLTAVAVVFYYSSQLGEVADQSTVSYSPILGVFALNVLLYILALRGIKKDEALVRSADRIR